MALTFKPKRQLKLPILKLLALAVAALILLLGSDAFSATEKERNALKDQIGRYQIIHIPQDEWKRAVITYVLDTVTSQIKVCVQPINEGKTKIYCNEWSEDNRDEYGK